jgi:hypothetical protein
MLIGVALAFPGTASGAFHEVTGTAVNDPGRSAVSSAIADGGGIPHLLWVELNGTHYELHAAKLSVSSWVPLGAAISTSVQADHSIGIASVGGVPEVTNRVPSTPELA